MDKAWQKYVDIATGLTEVTRKRAEQTVKSLVKQGEVAAERAENVVDELLKRSEANRKAITAIVRAETEKAIGRLGLARQKDVEKLETKVDKVDRKATVGGTRKASKKKSSAAKRSAKKGAAKKGAAKKGAAKKTTARKATKKGASKKRASKKATKKSSAARRTAAKKTAQSAKKSAPPSGS